MEVNENCPPQIREALTECSNGIRISESKADIYLQLSRDEADDAVFEACRSMHQFYSSSASSFWKSKGRSRTC